MTLWLTSWHALVGIVRHERHIQCKRNPLTCKQEENGEEGLRAHLGQRELWSARTCATHVVQLRAQVNGVNVVRLEVRVQDDL